MIQKVAHTREKKIDNHKSVKRITTVTVTVFIFIERQKRSDYEKWMKGKRLDGIDDNNNSHTHKKNVLIPKRSETKQNSITYLLCDIQYANRQMSWLLKMVANKRTNELNVHSSWLQLVQHSTPAR